MARSPFDPRGGLSAADVEPLVAEGLSAAEIAGRLGINPDRVRRALRRHGLKTRQSLNRQKAKAALERGDRDVELECRRHGAARHVLEGRGTYRCTRCRAERVSAHRRKIKRVLVAEAGGCCELCGYDRCAAALQFHHRDPALKDFHLSLRGVTRSLAEVRAEASKCALLCATCHAEVESGFVELPGVDSNHHDLINSQACCHYITGD